MKEEQSKSSAAHHGLQKVTAGGVLVALGIIFGDIGTSPLYVLKAIVGERSIDPLLILGGLSCVFWTLTLLTTLKYVMLTLRADNKGEGGVFSLYTLVRRRYPLLIFPALIGGSALLADGVIAPCISVSSAVEGLHLLYPGIRTVPIVVTILVLLFSVQRFGTRTVGRTFGPIMLVWFIMLAILGGASIIESPSVLRAINPWYAVQFIGSYPGAFWILGAVFLCTTGAEALYSDLGHCGRGNIKVTWPFVKIALLLNYFGQGAWLLRHEGSILGSDSPFYQLMPDWFLGTGIVIATVATVIASQAVISGSFTIVNEAMRLYLFPKLKISYPTEVRGQLYIPGVNLALLVGCIGIILYFQESRNLVAVYGLAITIGMLMTTILLIFWLLQRRVRRALIALFVALYLPLELSFLTANLEKLTQGGIVTITIGGTLVFMMWVWNRASMLKRSYTEYVGLDDYLPILRDLSLDSEVPKTATHLVYLTGSAHPQMIEAKIIYSLLRKFPKRADVYWFVHVNVLDEPYTSTYEVTTLLPGKIFRVDFHLGFRIEPRINLLFRKVIDDMARSGEIDLKSNYESLRKYDLSGDFRFVVLEKSLSYDNDLAPSYQLIMDGYFLMKRIGLREEESFGLDTSSVIVEKVPLVIAPVKNISLSRIGYTPDAAA